MAQWTTETFWAYLDEHPVRIGDELYRVEPYGTWAIYRLTDGGGRERLETVQRAFEDEAERAVQAWMEEHQDWECVAELIDGWR